MEVIKSKGQKIFKSEEQRVIYGMIRNTVNMTSPIEDIQIRQKSKFKRLRGKSENHISMIVILE